MIQTRRCIGQRLTERHIGSHRADHKCYIAYSLVYMASFVMIQIMTVATVASRGTPSISHIEPCSEIQLNCLPWIAFFGAIGTFYPPAGTVKMRSEIYTGASYHIRVSLCHFVQTVSDDCVPTLKHHWWIHLRRLLP